MGRFKKSLVLILALVLGAVVWVGQSSAESILTEEEETAYSLNNILFYNPCGKNGGSSSACGITVSGSTIEEKIWSGLVSFMTEEQAAGVMGNMAHEGGFNPARHETLWLLTAPNFDIAKNTSQSYGIGLIQWSFGRRVKLYEFISQSTPDLWTKYIDEGRQTYGKMSGKDFLAEAGDADTNSLIALELCYLKQELENNSSFGGVLKTTTVAEASNYFLEHVEIPANIPAQRPIRLADAERYYAEFHGKTITGSSGSAGETGGDPACDSSYEGSKNINGAAVALAWPYGTDKKVFQYAQANGLTSTSAYNHISKWTGGKATDAFNNALESVYPEHKKWSQCPSIGASCDVGVGTVVRYSGVDPDFPRGLGEQIDYARAHSDIWEIINASGATPQAGDVVNNTSSGHHTYIVVQDENGDFYRVESGLCSNFWRVSRKFTKFEAGAKIFRAKNANNSTTGISVTDGVKTSSKTGTISDKTQGNGDINASALELAWPEDTNGAENKSATKRFEEVFATLKGGPGSGCWKNGKSCSVFVNTVLLYAGAQTGQKVKSPGGIADDMIESDDWEEIEGGEDLNHSDLQPGDVIVYYQRAYNPGNESKHSYKGLHTGHIAIYVEDANGEGKIAEASFCNHYGKIYNKAKGNVKRGWAGARVFRWKKQKGGSYCNICGGGEADAAGLKAGGMTLAEAKEWIKQYHDAAMGVYYKKRGNISFLGADIYDAGCPFGVMNNCVALSQWFINKYTTIGPNWNNTTNGVGLVDKLVNSKGLEKGKNPRPYAIFSNGEWSSAGHTGVVLGVDTDAKKIVVAEASCSSGGTLNYPPRVTEYTFERVKNWSYAYTDNVLKGDVGE
ncbi:hypothetical protein IJG28_02475 [Candidatus Saccharibacteria bacterium]|nr:hypothetical protein [Candidatus Saccharibacteria bacterium]